MRTVTSYNLGCVHEDCSYNLGYSHEDCSSKLTLIMNSVFINLALAMSGL